MSTNENKVNLIFRILKYGAACALFFSSCVNWSSEKSHQEILEGKTEKSSLTHVFI